LYKINIKNCELQTFVLHILYIVH